MYPSKLAVTVSSIESEAPPVPVAVIVTVPVLTASAVTRPSASTVALSVSDEDHVIAPPSDATAASWRVVPLTTSVEAGGVIVTVTV